MTKMLRLADYRFPDSSVHFDRNELRQVLQIYSRRVANGEWKDYAIGHEPGRAEFAVFRHAAAGPAYTIAKMAIGNRGDIRYVVSRGPRRLKQGRTMGEALSIFDRDLRVVPTCT